MKGRGGFDHNVQTLSVVTELELRYPQFVGLNLTWETLEGIVKHNGPVAQKLGEPAWEPVRRFNEAFDLRLDSWASAETTTTWTMDCRRGSSPSRSWRRCR
jgi:dGTPase